MSNPTFRLLYEKQNKIYGSQGGKVPSGTVGSRATASLRAAGLALPPSQKGSVLLRALLALEGWALLLLQGPPESPEDSDWPGVGHTPFWNGLLGSRRWSPLAGLAQSDGCSLSDPKLITRAETLWNSTGRVPPKRGVLGHTQDTHIR